MTRAHTGGISGMIPRGCPRVGFLNVLSFLNFLY